MHEPTIKEISDYLEIPEYFVSEALLKKVVGNNIWCLLIALVIAIVVCVIIAILTERFAYRPLRQKGSSRITALITAIGVSYILSGIMNAIEPEQVEFHSFFNKNVSFYIAIITTAVLLIILTLFVKKTKIGIAMRAVSENESAAKLMGINNNFIISLTVIIGLALAAIGVVIYLLDGVCFTVELG